MTLFRTVAEIRAFSAALHREGKTLALVPTMGFLHEGHQSLIREAKKRAELCAVTIFVNPAQFGANEDLSKYPRDEAGDLKKCETAGADVVWAPSVAEVYPPGFQTNVDITEVSQGLCGRSRPVHFRGVATIVTKLLALFRPDVALFGEKDYQQLQVISRLNRDLDLGVKIVGMPIVREADGLALSSRNVYLSPPERLRALTLSRSLKAAVHACQNGERSVERLKSAARSELAAAELTLDYLEIVDPLTLKPLETVEGPARILVAAFVGKTRLIDNLALGG